MVKSSKKKYKKIWNIIIVTAFVFTIIMAPSTKANSTITTKNMDITNMSKVVGICYSVWQDVFASPQPNNTTTILKNAAINKAVPQWGMLHSFHYFSQPVTGYHSSTDTTALTSDIMNLQNAGVDFLIIDATNLFSTTSQTDWNTIFNNGATALCNTLVSLRNQNIATPYVVFWGRTSPSDPDSAYVGRRIFNDFVNNSAYAGLFVNFEGKPLFLTTDTLPSELNNYYTLRKMWGLQTSLADKEWSYLSSYPQKIGKNGTANEQISVSVANQRDYMSNFSNATPKRGGISWAQQWQKAFSVNPKIVTITWWNEQAAQRFTDADGNTRFVDGYVDPEWNRDIEPKVGGYGDSLLQMMSKYISAYKNEQPFPVGLVLDSVSLGDFEVGNEGWQAGQNLSTSYDQFSEGGTNIPAARSGYKLFQANDAAVAGSALKTIKRVFEQPVDLSTNPYIKYNISSWTGCPNADSYVSTIKVVATNGECLSQETTLKNPSAWQEICLNTSSWPYNNSIASIEIGTCCPGVSQAWCGTFFVDKITADSDGYNIGDFDLCTDGNNNGWVNGTNASSVNCVTAGETDFPQAYSNSKVLKAVSAAVAGNAYKNVYRSFSDPINVSEYNNISLGINAWGGCPGASSYTFRVTLYDNEGHSLQTDITRSSTWPNWQTVKIDIGSWEYRNKLSKVEIGFCSNSSSPWYCQFFIDKVLFSSDNKYTMVPIDFSHYTISGNKISGLTEKMTPDAFLSNVLNLSSTKIVYIYDSHGSEIAASASAYIGTGSTVKVTQRNSTDEYITVIPGDVSGDGIINTSDLIMVKNELLGRTAISGEANRIAGDLSGEGDIKINDLLELKGTVLEN